MIKKFPPYHSSKGMSLIEVLIALSLLSIASLAIISLIQNYNRSVLSIEEKLAILDLEKTLVNLSIGKNICEKKFLENPATYTYPLANFPIPTVAIDALYLLTSDTIPIAEKNSTIQSKNNVIVESIEFENISGSGDSYFADLIIKFKGTVISRRPLITKVLLSGNIVGTNLVLTKCMAADNVANKNPAAVDNETSCNNIGGEWIQPGGTRPDFCSFPGEIIEWY